jgi:competence protein ComEA
MYDIIGENKKKEIIFYSVVVAIILIVVLIIYFKTGFDFLKKSDNHPSQGAVYQSQTDNNSSKEITVEIVGAVLNPGVYNLQLNAKMNDLIIKSGGLLKEANSSYIKRMAALEDGDKIVIPFRFDYEEYRKDMRVITRDDIGNEYEKVSDVIYRRLPQQVQSSDKININTASKEQLMVLSGIGSVTADNIIEYRANNRFGDIEELMNVSRIGPKMFERLKENITVR